jgi:hypothetical protein
MNWNNGNSLKWHATGFRFRFESDFVIIGAIVDLECLKILPMTIESQATVYAEYGIR